MFLQLSNKQNWSGWPEQRLRLYSPVAVETCQTKIRYWKIWRHNKYACCRNINIWVWVFQTFNCLDCVDYVRPSNLCADFLASSNKNKKQNIQYWLSVYVSIHSTCRSVSYIKSCPLKAVKLAKILICGPFYISQKMLHLKLVSNQKPLKRCKCLRFV